MYIVRSIVKNSVASSRKDFVVHWGSGVMHCKRKIMLGSVCDVVPHHTVKEKLKKCGIVEERCCWGEKRARRSEDSR